MFLYNDYETSQNEYIITISLGLNYTIANIQDRILTIFDSLCVSISLLFC